MAAFQLRVLLPMSPPASTADFGRARTAAWNPEMAALQSMGQWLTWLDYRLEQSNRLLEKEGSNDAPSLSELSPDDLSLATLHVLDYEGGLADEMAHCAALKRGEALHVFVNDDGGVSGAQPDFDDLRGR